MSYYSIEHLRKSTKFLVSDGYPSAFREHETRGYDNEICLLEGSNLSENSKKFVAQSRCNFKNKGILTQFFSIPYVLSTKEYNSFEQKGMKEYFYFALMFVFFSLLLTPFWLCALIIVVPFYFISVFVVIVLTFIAYLYWTFKENREIGIILVSSILVTKYQIPLLPFYIYLGITSVVLLISFLTSDVFIWFLKLLIDWYADVGLFEGLLYFLREKDIFSRCNPYTKKLSWSNRFVEVNGSNLYEDEFTATLNAPDGNFEFIDDYGVCKVFYLEETNCAYIKLIRNNRLISSYKFIKPRSYNAVKKVFYNYFNELFSTGFTFLICTKNKSGEDKISEYHSLNFNDSMEYILNNYSNLNVKFFNSLLSIGSHYKFNVLKVHKPFIDSLIGCSSRFRKFFEDAIFHNLLFFRNGKKNYDGRFDILNYVLRNTCIFKCPIKSLNNLAFRKYRSDLNKISCKWELNKLLQRKENLKPSPAAKKILFEEHTYEIDYLDVVIEEVDESNKRNEPKKSCLDDEKVVDLFKFDSIINLISSSRDLYSRLESESMRINVDSDLVEDLEGLQKCENIIKPPLEIFKKEGIFNGPDYVENSGTARSDWFEKSLSYTPKWAEVKNAKIDIYSMDFDCEETDNDFKTLNYLKELEKDNLYDIDKAKKKLFSDVLRNDRYNETLLQNEDLCSFLKNNFKIKRNTIDVIVAERNNLLKKKLSDPDNKDKTFLNEKNTIHNILNRSSFDKFLKIERVKKKNL